MTTEKEFDVSVCRTSYAFATLRVTATSAEEATAKALEEAGNHSYSEKDADYSVDAAMPVEKPSKRGLK